MAPFQVSQRAQTSNAGQPISVLIRTDHEKYSTADTVKLDVSLQNTSDATVYVDRRMFWGGYAGGCRLKTTTTSNASQRRDSQSQSRGIPGNQ
jgi:hypothetical protein